MQRPELDNARDVLHSVSPTSLYVHIPFCKSRCFYCDFTTYVAPAQVINAYVDHLLQEFALLAPMAANPLKTIFFGGGTPTVLSSAQWRRLMTGLRQAFPVSPDAEITVEANPGSVQAEKLAVLREAGVNRISFGAQSFNDRLLLAIGRLHDADTVRESVRLAKQAGFERINVDLMFGLPEQTLADVQEAVDALAALDICHVSAYWLKVETGTPFADWQAKGALPLPGEDAEAEMYDAIQSALSERGLKRYEVSNFAVHGHEAAHNLVYWHNEPYLAVGVGAHGYVGGERYENTHSLTEYARHVSAGVRPVTARHSVSVAESMENTMMLGLRLAEGVDRRRFAQRHGVDLNDVFGAEVADLAAKQLVEWRGERLVLTDRAWPVANLVFEAFIGALAD
ncbi:coproporphyrinogen III oxidase [Alicyclobacillus contaminans]|uniref:radical SAM family heme chaperone HemW n=1 Tax=Alicyclobacillus contaminans TaxID=392016 RepID=UPI0006877587|nr:radical SAM family heme chaperone HemW [Alicyclobacillus contaminans]GMA52142.1 coproporphyrinogen III oxidase [Alicyclobacillus contaminans]